MPMPGPSAGTAPREGPRQATLCYPCLMCATWRGSKGLFIRTMLTLAYIQSANPCSDQSVSVTGIAWVLQVQTGEQSILQRHRRRRGKGHSSKGGQCG